VLSFRKKNRKEDIQQHEVADDDDLNEEQAGPPAKSVSCVVHYIIPVLSGENDYNCEHGLANSCEREGGRFSILTWQISIEELFAN
jgi:hypothetical protein